MFDPRDHWLVPEWPAPRAVRAIVTTREGGEAAAHSPFGFNVGTRCGDDPAAVARNRAFLVDALALPSEPRWLKQVHGTRAVVLEDSGADPFSVAGDGEPRAGRTATGPGPKVAGAGEPRTAAGTPARDPEAPEADAAVARTPGVVLAIQTADCLPVLLCADDGSEIGAAHAGWRGLSAGVLEATLAALQTPRERVLAWLGPAIAAPSYEVGEEVRAAFTGHDPAAASAFTAARPGHWHCNLYALARQRLRSMGVTRISGAGLDTFTDRRLHSYRRDGARSGRMVSLVWIARQPRSS